ncbi:hypothetical protein BRD00_05035 [Halobacteriales archaeon QS_8_69_26]|nr:MAG: hypothetical protein BRD00_05035 [Halobacteriales archaeon QS_8_69_26]
MSRTLADRAREAARRHPFLLAGLATGVVNYTAAARFLDLSGEEEAVATALRRYAEDLERSTDGREARVTMRTGVGVGSDPPGDSPDTAGNGSDPLLSVGGTAVTDGGDHTALLARGSVDGPALAAVLRRMDAAGIDPAAAGVAGDALVVVVGRRAGADALRVVEDALESVSSVGSD